MLDSLSYWLHETPLGEALLTMFISMLPVVELRGGLPAGVAMGLPLGAHTYPQARALRFNA